MTGPEHYTEAERILALATASSSDSFVDDLVIAAQAHATLALAAATALTDDAPYTGRYEWQQAAGLSAPARAEAARRAQSGASQ